MNGIDLFETNLAMAEYMAAHDAKCQHIYDTELARLGGSNSTYNEYNRKGASTEVVNVFKKVEHADICICKKCKESNNTITLTNEQFERLYKLFEEKLNK